MRVANCLSAILVLSASLLPGCGKDSKSDSRESGAAGVSAAEYPGTLAGAKALLGEFLKPSTDRGALTAGLRPEAKDYMAVFEDSAFAAAAATYYEKAWSGGVTIKPNPGQTELLVWSATTEDLKAGTGDSKNFPGGYAAVSGKFRKGLTVYRFKFVKPGDTMGMAYDGLIHVNGHWRIFPKPWRVQGGS